MKPCTSMLLAAALLPGAALLTGCHTMIEPPPLDPSRAAMLESWLDAHGESPADYVIGLFADHDVVLLGEQHRVKHDLLFVQSLLAPLYRAGVRTFATEFGRREDQARIDALVTAPEWDEDEARSIVFDQFPAWGYQEYVDLYRRAWELNHGLRAGEPRLRVLGMNDSPDWSLIRKPEDRDDPAVMKRVWRGGNEGLWAGVVLDAVESGSKVLVHSGIHHAFSEFRQPVVDQGTFVRFTDDRMGNHIYRAIGKRAVTVYLHAPWNGAQGYGDDMVHPIDGAIDALMLAVAGGPRPVGFDVAGSPFGDLTCLNCVYRHGSEFRLADFCDGWIYTKPISEYEGVTPIEGWVNDSNLEQARLQSPNLRLRHLSAGEFNAMIAREADIGRRWGHLR